MPNVTFDFKAQQAAMGVTIQNRSNLRDVTVITFQTSGKRTVPLSNGVHDVGYRVVGTPNTAYDLQVTAGGIMNPVSRTLGGNGQGAGVRTLTVP
jgi:hypothetical protein